MKKLILLTTILCITATAHAEQAAYMGLGLGYTNKEYESGSILAKTKVPQGFSSSHKEDQDRLGLKLYGGYQFNDNFAIEGGYAYLNKNKLSLAFQKAGDKLNGQLQTKLHTLFVTANGIIPLNDSFAVFGKAGLAWMHAKNEASINLSSSNDSTHVSKKGNRNSVTPVIGAGAEWKLNKSLALRAEYEYFGKPKVTDSIKMKRVDMFSVGLRMNFN